jgi:transposase
MERTKSELARSIRYLREIKRLSFRQVAAELNISRGKCLRLYAATAEESPPRTTRLENHRALIAAWFQEHPSLKAIQVFRRLREREIDVGYSTVKDFTQSFRRRRPPFYHTLSFEPGEEAQVDWFFLTHPRLGKLAGFAFLLSYSRYFFARFFPRHSFEFFIEGYVSAFAQINGVLRALRYDNLSSVVLSRAPLRYNPAFLDFARHYGFEIRLCNVGRANEKGRVERTIRTVRETFCNTAADYHTLDSLNAGLRKWCREKNSAVHRSTGKTPDELRVLEPLTPLPAGAWRNEVVLPPVRSSKTGLMTFDTNKYSVPDYSAGLPVSIHASCNRLEFFDAKGRRIASHPRSFERSRTFINTAHRSFARISPQAKRERIHAVIRNLDPAVERFLSLAEGAGEDPLASAYGLFLLLRSHARATVVSAIREALQRRMPRMNFVRSLLRVPPAEDETPVLPQQQCLLDIDYQPRPLDDYE